MTNSDTQVPSCPNKVASGSSLDLGQEESRGICGLITHHTPGSSQSPWITPAHQLLHLSGCGEEVEETPKQPYPTVLVTLSWPGGGGPRRGSGVLTGKAFIASEGVLFAGVSGSLGLCGSLAVNHTLQEKPLCLVLQSHTLYERPLC